MDNTYLTEAFKKLDLLNEEDFNLADDSSVDSAKNFMSMDDVDNSIDVIDSDAQEEKDLANSYVGKVILDCEVCHSKLYKDAADIQIDKESGLVNEDEECPFCYSTEGYKIVGQVAPFTGESESEEPVEDEDEVDESCHGSNEVTDSKNLKENYFAEELLEENSNRGALGAKVGDIIIDRKTGKEGKVEKQGQSGNYGLIYVNFGNGLRKINPMDDAQRIGRYELKTEDYCPKCGKHVDEPCDKCKEEESDLSEAFEKVEIETATDKLEMQSDANGKVTVTSEPKSSEVLAPVEANVESEIEMNSESEEDDMNPEADIDYELDDFVEESFDRLAEAYLKKAYENVDTFKTASASSKGNKLTVEGVIKFTSGKEKKTQFIFESKDATKNGKVRFIGENAQLTKGKKAFSVLGRVEDKKFISESFNYNYRVKNSEGKSVKLYGTVSNKK